MKLDGKFYGEIRKAKNDEVVPEDEWVCFLIKDNAFYEILPIYLAKCIKMGCDDYQIDAILRMIRRGTEWRKNNPKRLKIPDAKGERLLDI